MEIHTEPDHFWTEDLSWFFKNFKMIYHLSCVWADG